MSYLIMTCTGHYCLVRYITRDMSIVLRHIEPTFRELDSEEFEARSSNVFNKLKDNLDCFLAKISRVEGANLS